MSVIPKVFYTAVPEGRMPDIPKPGTSIHDVVPQDKILVWSTQLAILMNLTWEYVFTVLDIATQMRIPETKRIARAVRELHSECLHYKRTVFTPEGVEKEAVMSERFEDGFNEDFNRLCSGIQNEIAKLRLKGDWPYLVLATHQAMTLLDATLLCAGMVDRELAEVWHFHTDRYCLLPRAFLKLPGLVPLFAGDCYRRDMEVQRVSARIIANRMMRQAKFTVDGREPDYNTIKTKRK